MLASAVRRSRLDATPLLVVRLPDLERIAWRAGRRAARTLERCSSAAFYTAAQTVLRSGDRVAHEPGGVDYVAALLAPTRSGSGVALPADCRSTLTRLEAALQGATGLQVETGWTTVVPTTLSEDFSGPIEDALARGRRERERYAFFATIGHELRTPLTSIRGYVETILGDELDAATLRRFLETIGAEAGRLGRLVDGLFAVSLLDLSIPASATMPTDLGVAVRRAVDVMAPLAARRRVEVTVGAGIDQTVAISPDHLVQIVLNVLENAVKHGRSPGRIVIASAPVGRRYVELRIDDDGDGVACEDRERIFLFGRRGERRAGSGTGIGLSVVRLMTERVGGEIDVVEAPIGGARFRIRLPTYELYADSRAALESKTASVPSVV